MMYPTKRKKKYNVGNIEDRISKLPDEILVSILSHLSLKEAQATGILSKRWRNMCSFSTTLDFDGGKCLDIFKRPRNARERPYVMWVDSVLNQHRAANIERLRIAFEVGSRGSCIDEWIRFAMRKGVQFLELDLSSMLCSKGPRYQFSNQVLCTREFSSFNTLCSEYIGFKLLKVVDFNRVDVEQDIVEYFIYNCPVLEQVAVCDSSLLVDLRVVGKSIALKYLTIQQCLNLKSIEICEANLVSFTYGGDIEKLHLQNLPLLVEVSLPDKKGTLSRKIDFSYLSCCLSHLEILKTNYMIYRGEADPICPLLPNLKCLELGVDETNLFALIQLAFFLRQTPCLHTLVVKFHLWESCPTGLFARKRATMSCHDCLKVVKFTQYTGIGRQTEIVEYFLKTAGNLEKIIFDPVNPHCRVVDRFLFPHLVRNKEILSRAEARRLKRQLPESLEVVCL